MKRISGPGWWSGWAAVVYAVMVLMVLFAASPAMAAEQLKPEPPEIDSPGAVLMDPMSGKILFNQQGENTFEPASVTKLMTLDLVFEALEAKKLMLDDEVQVSEHAASWGGSQIWLEPGEVITVGELIDAVAIASANDAAVALAEAVSGSHEGFVSAMNQQAENLGLKNTHFTNAHGLPADDHYTSPKDMALLGAHLIKEHPDVLNYTGTWRKFLHENDPDRDNRELNNTNHMLKTYQGMDGLKTGYTSRAGYNLVATASQNGSRFLAAVFGSETLDQRHSDVRKLLDFAFAHFESIHVIDQGSVEAEVPVEWGRQQQIALVTRRALWVAVPLGQDESLEKTVEVEMPLQAPLDPNEPAGQIIVQMDGSKVGQVDLVPQSAVERIGFGGLTWRLLQQAWVLEF